MAQYEEKNGQGVAFKKEKTSAKHPDWSGTFLTPKGEKLQIAIWERTSAKGTAYLSIGVSEPFVKKEEQQPVSKEYYPTKDEPSDGLPF